MKGRFRQLNNIYIVKRDGSEEIVSSDYFKQLNISIKGKNNTVKIGEGIRFTNCKIVIDGNDNYFSIGSTYGMINSVVFSMPVGLNNRKIIIGDNFESGYCFILNNVAGKNIIIGDECLFSEGIHIRTGDGHAMFDVNSNEVFNITTQDVVIGSHVWVGRNVYFGKGSGVGDNSVVGYGSIVTKKHNYSNVALAGNPAKIIKHNISWTKKSPEEFQCSHQNKKIIAVIPSRYASSRFPGKPLADILGKPMIQWVYERVKLVEEISEVYVATDDQRIFDTVTSFGGNAIMTGECACGTDRIYQACKDIDCDIVLNIQGDEPMIKVEMIRDLISAFNDSTVKMATLKKELTEEADINNPNIAKLITDVNSDAVYFSRSTMPYNRDKRPNVKYFKHIGVYAYTKEFLKTFVKLPQSPLEIAEQLEQLRAIENGYKIRVVETKYQSIGVDLPEHIQIVETEMKKEMG